MRALPGGLAPVHGGKLPAVFRRKAAHENRQQRMPALYEVIPDQIGEPRIAVPRLPGKDQEFIEPVAVFSQLLPRDGPALRFAPAADPVTVAHGLQHQRPARS